MYQIDKNIPLPTSFRKNGSYRYPFRDMKVGDSFSLADASQKTEAAVRNAIHRFRKSAVAQFSVLTTPGETNKRVFRTA